MALEERDLHCQWCKKVLAVAVNGRDALVVEETREYQGKYYCEEPCFQNLLKLEQFVRSGYSE